MFGVFLWQKKGFPGFPVVEIGDKDTAVVSIYTTAGAHDPMAIA